MGMGRGGRTLIALVDAVLMGAAAYAQTGIPSTVDAADLVLWGAVLAAAVCAFVIWSGGIPALAWIAIGYVLFGALLTSGAPHWPLLALAVALMPLVQRPRGSLLVGLGLAFLSALVARIAVAAII